ncbi:hypothetical protein [Caloranaerobacter sp. DY30410]|uniref:hypothetical protein n=1 Tax=Caloranaerobacter sp. DY30410 TaxID=3238305 RepID=UPI003CFE8B1A
MKTCAYCGSNQNKLTAEHIIPSSLIRLYPEQDVNITPYRIYKNNKGHTINDVCSKCNNEILGDLDNYGVKLVKEFFLTEYNKDDIIDFEYDYDMLARWLLKIAYNLERSLKSDVKWFRDNIDYILNGKNLSNNKFSIFSGLYVDMTPIGEEEFGFVPLNILKEPLIYKHGVAHDYFFSKIGLRDEFIYFKGVETWFIYRFGSGIFIVFLWSDNIQDEIIKKYELFFEEYYPYNMLIRDGHRKLRRVTDNFSCIHLGWISSNIGIELSDNLIKSSLNGREVHKTREDWRKKRTKADIMKGRIMNEHHMFPDNKKVKKQFDKLFK